MVDITSQNETTYTEIGTPSNNEMRNTGYQIGAVMVQAVGFVSRHMRAGVERGKDICASAIGIPEILPRTTGRNKRKR